MSGLARRSRIGWHERNTIIHGLAEDGRILTHHRDSEQERRDVSHPALAVI